PGAREISEFERKVLARLNGHAVAPPSGEQKAALMLEKQSLLNFRIPDPSQQRPYRTASLLAETRVNRIQLKPLAPDTFKPPKGFSDMGNAPKPETVPPESPEATGHTIEIIAPNLLHAGEVSS